MRAYLLGAFAIATLTLLVLLRPMPTETPDSLVGYTPQGDIHGMLLAEQLYTDLTFVFTTADAGTAELPPYPGRHEQLADVLDQYRAVVDGLREEQLCLQGNACPDRDRIVLNGIEELLAHGSELARMQQNGRLDASGVRAFRQSVMDGYADTLDTLSATLEEPGSAVFRQGAILARLGSLAAAAGDRQERARDYGDEAEKALSDAREVTEELDLDGGPGGEFSRSVVQVRGTELLARKTIDPETLLTLHAHMFRSLEPARGTQDIDVDMLDEHVLASYANTASALRLTLIRQLDPPPAMLDAEDRRRPRS